MLKVPIDVFEFYFIGHLDPKDLSQLSAITRKFKRFKSEKHVSKKYKESVNEAFYEACQDGHQKLAQFLIDEKGADNFNHALNQACCSGHQDIAKWLIEEKGALLWSGLGGACYGGHQEIAQYLIDEKGAWNLEAALGVALYRGHKDLVEWLEQKIHLAKILDNLR